MAFVVISVIAYITYKMTESGEKLMIYIINTFGVLCMYCVSYKLRHFFLLLIVSIVTGIIFGKFGMYMANKEQNLNRYLGTTILVELIVNFIIYITFSFFLSATFPFE